MALLFIHFNTKKMCIECSSDLDDDDDNNEGP
jgi:hypothetical protein